MSSQRNTDPTRDEDVPEGEMYKDAITGEMRRRRGTHKRVKRGPYSREEQTMINAFDLALSAQRRMHGALAQSTCVDLAQFLTQWRVVVERYSYENLRDVSAVDPHVVFAELDVQPFTGVDAPAVYTDESIDLSKLVLCVLARARAYEKNQQFADSGVSS